MNQSALDVRWTKDGTQRPAIRIVELVGQDAAGKQETVGHYLVERIEPRRDHSASFAAASLKLEYRLLQRRGDDTTDTRNWFGASYNEFANTISLTTTSTSSNGYVLVSPHRMQGKGFGTYLMNEIVEWAKQFPDASINTIYLLEGQGRGKNRARRNRFYEQFGITFEYDSPEQITGQSKPMKAADLVTVSSWKSKVIEHEIQAFIERILDEKSSALMELRFRTQAVRDINAQLREAERKPIRWALWQHRSTLLTAAVIGLLSSIVFFHF